MTILITLTLPPGGDAGPFDLYSNTDGYTIPFATNVSAAALIAGYTATNVPDGTTTIRVQSVGVCTNFVDVQVNVLPTTTTTSSSSSSSTTTTSTTAVPTTTTTSSSTSTSTSSSTTTTTTTCPCYNWTIVSTQADVDAGLNLEYINCDDDPVNETIIAARSFTRCIQSGSTPELFRDDSATLEGSTLTKTSQCCTSPPPASTTTTSTTGEFGPLIVENNSSNLTVNTVTSEDGFIIITSNPVALPGVTRTGSHGDLPQAIDVDVTSNAAPNCMSLYINNVFIEQVTINGTGTYSFAANFIPNTDVVKIVIVNLACIEPE
jgi:hypothetical protein